MKRLNRRERVLLDCERHGVTVVPLEGCGYRLLGHGIDIKVADLIYVYRQDLHPVHPEPKETQ